MVVANIKKPAHIFGKSVYGGAAIGHRLMQSTLIPTPR
jgi:hypothetical protein